MLYKDAVEIKADSGEISEQYQPEDAAKHQMLFDKVDISKVAIRDNGDLKSGRGQIITKKFKYLNSTESQLSIEVISNAPAVVVIKTPVLIIPPDSQDQIKFVINTPKTPCLLDAKILIRNLTTLGVEELILFRIDVD